jgi:LacI family gluconate utilization system Gnt-I transcriptional repressor
VTTKPTLKDVAAVAGVSPITVSRALRSPHLVTPDTRERVTAAVARTGYVSDGIAAQLAGAASPLVAAMVPTLEAPYFVEGLRGLADTAEAARVSVTVGQTNYRPERADALVRAMLGARPRGVVLFGSDLSGEGRAALVRADLPAVEAWELVHDPIGLCVGFSHEGALHALTRRLIAAGRRHPVFLARDPGQRRGAARHAGYARAMREAGLEPRLVFREAETAVRSGVLGAAALLEAGGPVDALVCAADNLALGAMAALVRAGRRIPDDVAVTGFGDLDFAAETAPSITTVRVPDRDIGRIAAEFLLAADWRERLSAGPRTVDVGWTIVERESAPLGA